MTDTPAPAPRIGVAGCGAMGLPMARALLAAGFPVSGFDIRPKDEFGDFAPRMVDDPADFAGGIDILISVVRDQRQTLDLYFDAQAIFAQSRYPKTCLLASTVSPRFLHAVRGRLPADAAFIDIPMSGAPIAAEQARLTFMAGASKDDARPIAPLLNAMGREIHYLGGFAQGMAAKVLNNFVAASSVAAVRQVLSDAPRLGVAPEALLAVMAASSGATWFGGNFDAISWSRETYDPANTIGIVEKDVNSLLDALNGLAEPLDSAARAYVEAVRDRLSTLPPAPGRT